MLKLQCYDGTDSLDTFLRKFYSMSWHLQWNEDAMYHLCGCLEGAAGQVLWDIGPSATTADVIMLLQTRFGIELQAEWFKAELCVRRRCPDETLQNLYRDISRLVSLAYPSEDAKLTDHVGKESFINALNDGPLQMEVMKGEPSNLEAALNHATKIEAYEQSLITQGTLSKSSAYISVSDDDRPRHRSRAVNAVQGTGDDSAVQLRVDELQNLPEQATKGTAALVAETGAADKSTLGRDAGMKKPSTPKKGFKSRNFGKGKYGRNSGRKQDPKVDPCHTCGKVGHWARDCDQPKPPTKEQAQVNSISCRLVSPTRIYVTAYVGGKPVQCLLDSGCERSIISRNVVPNVQLTLSQYNLTVDDKANLPILGDTTLQFEVDGNRFEANVSVSPAIDDFLVGSDWLEANGAKWDFSTGTLNFGDRTIHTYRRTPGRVCRQVMVAKNYIVPPQHEANVPVKTSNKEIPHPADNWVIETKQFTSRVMTARRLINGNQERLVTRICNYSDEPYELKADCYLARTQPVECVPGPGEKLSDEVCSSENDVLPMCVLPGVSSSLHLLPTTGQDPTTTLRATTVSGSTTAAGTRTAVTRGPDATSVAETTPSTDSPTTDDPYNHIQCLLDGLPDDLIVQQCARATAFIQS